MGLQNLVNAGKFDEALDYAREELHNWIDEKFAALKQIQTNKQRIDFFFETGMLIVDGNIDILKNHQQGIALCGQLYKIVDRNGYEMPEHYSGRHRTYKEAKRMVDRLNDSSDRHKPYKMVPV